jgi:SOS-response transcriptional repressor LexA
MTTIGEDRIEAVLDRICGPDGDLTVRQAEIYRFLLKFAMTHGYPPSLRDIARHFRISGTNGVACHMDALVKKGKIRSVAKTSRAITFPGLHWVPFRIGVWPE